MYRLSRRLAKSALLRWEHATAERVRRRLGPAAHGLPPSCWDMTVNERGHLAVRGRDMVELAEYHGTPLHVVDSERLTSNYEAFIGSFRQHYPDVIVGYSYKTNPLPGALAHLHRLGAYAEVISHFELWLATRLGVPPEMVIFNGPAKTAASLEQAVRDGVYMINIDAADEIEAIDRLAGRYGRVQDVAVRVVTSVGWSSQFGLSIASGQAEQAFERLAGCENVNPRGIHIHLGTGLSDVDMYLRAIREVLDFAVHIRSAHGIRIDRFDFGGGFGVPTVRPLSTTDVRLLANGYPMRPMEIDEDLGPAVFAERISRLMAEYHPVSGPNAPTLILEPGRAITSSAQSLLLRVLGVKPGVGGPRIVIADGGRNISMPLGYEYHEILLASSAGVEPSEFYDLYGPLCHPSDTLALRKRLPEIEPGAVLAVMDAGAYFVPNQMNFSNPRPAAVMVDREGETTIRARESFEHVVALDELDLFRSPQPAAESNMAASSPVSRARE